MWYSESRLSRLERKIDAMLRAQNIELEMEYEQMKTMDELLVEVERQTTVSDSIAAMVNALQDEITAANGDKAKIQAAFDKVKANTDKLADAALENTPEGEGGSTGGVGGGSTGGVNG